MMDALTITPLDVSDDEALKAWHATYSEATVRGREHSTPWMLEEVRAELRAANPGTKVLAFGGYVDDQVVVTGRLDLPLKDNLSHGWLEVATLPALRKRGLGSAMLDHLTTTAVTDHSRSILSAAAPYPYDAPPDGSGQPNVEFLLHRGFSFGLGDVQRALDLPVDTGRLQRLADDAGPHHGDYEMRQFRGPVPGDIIDSFGDLIGSLMAEAPQGDLEIERESYDPERIRAEELMLEESGRTKYTTVAIAKDGTVAAYSELVVPRFDPGRAYQWGTLALPDHRGHRLGQATKARNLLWLQEERADLKVLITYNAEVNKHMIAVNDAMGFRPVERLGEFQKKLGQKKAR